MNLNNDGSKIEVKEDCFAYKNSIGKKEGECRALNSLYCKKESCRFYKPRNQMVD